MNIISPKEVASEFDKIDELKNDIIKSMNTNNPISRLRKDMIRRRARKLLKRELKYKKGNYHECNPSQI